MAQGLLFLFFALTWIISWSVTLSQTVKSGKSYESRMMTNGNWTTSSSRQTGCESAAVSHHVQMQFASSQGDEELNGVQYPAIKNAPLTVEGRGYESMSTKPLLFLLIGISSYISWEVSAGSLLRLAILIFTLLPGLAIFFWVMSRTSHRIDYHEPALPGLPIEHYLNFTDSVDRCRYRGHRRIDMWTFMHGYFDGTVIPKGDLLEILEYRHDFVSFAITTDIISYVLFTVIPGILARLLPRANARDEGRVQGHYDRGDDFYLWFAGPSMINSSGLLSDPSRKESIEEMQENKMAVVCEKLALGRGGPAKKTLLDLGCGFGSLAKYASVRYGSRVTGITLGQNPAAYGNAALQAAGVPEGQSRVLSMDYRDVPNLYGGSARYDAIVCLEMAEHVGIFKIVSLLRQCYDMLEDDGVMVLQVAGLRSAWQYEDIIWGLFVVCTPLRAVKYTLLRIREADKVL